MSFVRSICRVRASYRHCNALDSVERRAGVDAHLWADVEGNLPPLAEETLFRVAQEALAMP